MERAVFLAATLLLTTFGQLTIKSRSMAIARGNTNGRVAYLAVMFTDPGVLSGMAAALLASLCWALAIQRTPLSVAYPFMSLSFVLVPLGSAVWFGDSFSAVQFCGALLIVAGASLVAFAQ